MRGARGEEAVSSVVGTVLMLGVTMVAFAGLSYAVLVYFEDEAQPPRADLAVARQGGSLLLLAQGGEPVPLTDARVLVNVGGSEQEVAVSAMPGAAALGPTLDLGESLCIQGSDASRCLYPSAQDVRGVLFLTEGFLVAQSGPRGDPALPLPTPPDLTVSALSWTPLDPAAPEPVTFVASLTNGGGSTPAVTITISFRVDGVVVGSTQVAGPLASGSSAVIPSPPWASTAGSHSVTATADSAGAVSETDESNNQRLVPFSVAVGVSDPGFPFADVNGDAVYTGGTDTAIPTAEVSDGQYTCSGGSGLVVPPSIGALSAASISFNCNGKMTFGVSLTATAGALSLATGSDLSLATGATLSATGTLTLSPEGALFANGTTLRASALNVGDPSSGHSGTDQWLAGATLDSTQGTGSIAVQSLGSIDLTGARVTTKGALDVGGYGQARPAVSLRLSGAVLDTTLGTAGITIDDLSGSVLGDGSATRLASKGAIDVAAAQDVSFAQATLDNSAGSSAISLSGRAIGLSSATVRSSGAVTASGTGALACGACSVTAGGDVTLSGTGGTMDVASSTLAAATNRDLKLTVASGQQVLVQGATFRDRNDKADVTPNGAASGTPASGGVE